MQKSAAKAWLWFDEFGLFYSLAFLILFIPLWPKIPLFQPIQGYIVRVRLEDVFVFLIDLLFVLQVIRRKITMQTPLTQPILLYLLAASASLLAAIFITKNIPFLPNHIEKSTLHLFRYVEYFSLFFVSYFAVKNKAQAQMLLRLFFLTMLLATVYGAGQKYLKWPVYSTMNWEFSKGIVLELVSSSSRVPSTFAGHYDFAIYLTLLLPFLLAELLKKKGQQRRTAYYILCTIFLFSLWGLLAASLRSAFASFLVSTIVLITLLSLQLRTWSQRIVWTIKHLSFIFLVSFFFFFLFGQNLQNLFTHFFIRTTDTSVNESVATAIVDQYQTPIPKDPELAAEFYHDAPEKLSECALQKELSLCVRLESLWPAALRSFNRNPLFGTGFGTINKPSDEVLAPADGVDNNYLRILGETGILGFIAFAWIIFSIAKIAVASLRAETYDLKFSLAAAYLASMTGLLLNAVLFDVFASSKIAFTFWILTGITLSYFHPRKGT